MVRFRYIIIIITIKIICCLHTTFCYTNKFKLLIDQLKLHSILHFLLLLLFIIKLFIFISLFFFFFLLFWIGSRFHRCSICSKYTFPPQTDQDHCMGDYHSMLPDFLLYWPTQCYYNNDDILFYSYYTVVFYYHHHIITYYNIFFFIFFLFCCVSFRGVVLCCVFFEWLTTLS